MTEEENPMKKTSKRLLALWCAVMFLLLAHPVARAGELVESYEPWTLYGRAKSGARMYSYIDSDAGWLIPTDESMMIDSVLRNDSGKLYCYAQYHNIETSNTMIGYIPAEQMQLQSEPYPWSRPVYNRKDLFAVKESNTPCHKTPWKRDHNIRDRLDKGHLFRVYTSGINSFDRNSGPYTSWYRVSNMDAFVETQNAVHVGPILETTNKLITPLPEAFPKGESPGLDGVFTTNWPIKSVDITITVGNETVFTDNKSNLLPGWYYYAAFFNKNTLLDLPARYDAYKLNITATVAASNWPYPEEIKTIVQDMYFQIYQPATKVSFEHEEITAMPDETFDNPVLMEPDNATYPNYYTLTVQDNTIAKVEQTCPASFTALKEGSTRIFVQTLKPDSTPDEVKGSFELTVKRQTPDGLKYRIDGWDATIIGYSPDGDFWLVNIPDRVEGVPVTRIGERAFSGASNVTHIVLPNNIASIGEGAFYDCRQLESIVIPAGVTSIEDSTFQMCKSLSSATLYEGLTRIGESAFDGCCNLPSIILPAGVQSIGKSAFSGCSGLKSITIPPSVTSIGDYAFFGCSGLTSITLPANVASISYSAFAKCSGLTSITLPSSLTKIEGGAFQKCNNLSSITIPAGATSIGERAFSDCSGLTSITIPKSVTSIGDSVFKNTPVTIHGYLNSKAHQYATDNSIPFVALDAPPPLPGDANLDGKVNIQDLESLINYLVSKTPCKSMANADANGDKTVDIKDVKWIIDKIVGI
jgi:hypothetical protein